MIFLSLSSQTEDERFDDDRIFKGSNESLDAKWILAADYKPLYIGKIKELHEVPLDSKSKFKGLDGYPYSYIPNYYSYISDQKLSLKVNTSVTIKIDYISWYGFMEEWVDQRIIAYPVFIENNSVDTIEIGYNKSISIVLEAKNRKGEWEAIEEQRRGVACGLGSSTVVLPAGEIAITYCPIFKGNYHTIFRLKLGDNYSEHFSGRMNYSQFESIYDEEGKTKIKNQ